MSITANAIISFDENTLSTIEVYDASTYTSPDIISDVNAVRIMFATVNSVNLAGSTGTIKAWTEYTADQALTINNVSYATGDIIYLANDYTLSGSNTVTETGFYGERSSWLPSQATYTFFTPSQCYNTESVVFSDNVFTMKYELYTTVDDSGSLPSDGTYIVSGDVGDYIELTNGGAKYYVGEVFTSFFGELYTISGNAYVVLKDTETTLYFCTTGQAFEVLQSYVKTVANNMNAPQESKEALLKVIANYNVVDFTAAQQYGFDLQYMQNLLDEIQEYYAQLPWQ
jgi:hypothetical protein